MEELMCTCGQVQTVYHSDENQWEPECWECYGRNAGWVGYSASQDAVYVHTTVSPIFVDEDELPF
jgi:hypothetical protein